MKKRTTWVVGYENLYKIDTEGRVSRFDRKLKYVLMSDGRYRVRLCMDGKMTMHYVHVLVLEAFKGPRPPKHVAKFKDNNDWNYSLSNLEWVPRANSNPENPRLDSKELAKLTSSQRKSIDKLYFEMDEPLQSIADGFGISLSVVCRHLFGRYWKKFYPYPSHS
jgi:hypothetical protein